MKQLLAISSLFTLFLLACQPQEGYRPGLAGASSATTDPLVLDTFADLQVLSYDLPGWEKLSLQQKTFIYYLSEAALCGRDIIYDQYGKYNLAIRKTLEAIHETYKGNRNTPEWEAFETYSKRVWFSNGIHHHYNEYKILPGFSKEYFIELVHGSDPKALPMLPLEEMNLFVAKLVPVIFDPSIFPKRTSKEEGTDIIQGSGVNFYENCTAQQVDDFYKAKVAAAGENAPMIGLNSKLIWTNNKMVEQIWRAEPNSMYSKALQKVVENLQKAQPFAENDQQKKAIDLLISYLTTGDLRQFDAFTIAWVQDTASTVDFINGFIETYHDPKGYKADFEAMVQYNDPEATEKMAIISKNAQYFEDNSSIAAEHKKEKISGITYRVINVAMEAGACAPATPIGVNLPNSNWIKELYGSKSVSLNNIENAYNKAGGATATAEFAHDEAEIERSQKYGELCGKMHTALHEVIGHASGKRNPGVPEPNVTLKQYSSTLEEARADLVSLYFMPDPQLITWGLLPDAEAYKAAYDQYIRNALLQQYRRIQPGDDLEEDHMRNRQLVAAWALEKGAKEGVILRVQREGKEYYDIQDYLKLRQLFGELLREIQRIKSEGDFEAGKALVETYGVKVPAATVEQVKARYKSLPTKPYSGFVQPRLVAIKDKEGKIIDVKVEKERNFKQQMLRYGKEYGFLPIYN